MLMILLSTLNDQTFVLRQQLKLAFELESDLGDTVDWAGNGLFISMPEKLSLFSLTGQTNTGVILM